MARPNIRNALLAAALEKLGDRLRYDARVDQMMLDARPVYRATLLAEVFRLDDPLRTTYARRQAVVSELCWRVKFRDLPRSGAAA